MALVISPVGRIFWKDFKCTNTYIDYILTSSSIKDHNINEKTDLFLCSQWTVISHDNFKKAVHLKYFTNHS